MTKWLLVWIVGGQVTGASLPEQQTFATAEACKVAAAAINELAKSRIADTPTIVSATCIEVPAEQE